VPQGAIEPGVVLKRLVEISRPAPHITPGERPQEDRSANPSSEQSSPSARSDAIRLNFRKVIAASRRSSVSHRRVRQARQARKASALGAKGAARPRIDGVDRAWARTIRCSCCASAAAGPATRRASASSTERTASEADAGSQGAGGRERRRARPARGPHAWGGLAAAEL